jgi:hypothetical protein
MQEHEQARTLEIAMGKQKGIENCTMCKDCYRRVVGSYCSVKLFPGNLSRKEFASRITNTLK